MACSTKAAKMRDSQISGGSVNLLENSPELIVFVSTEGDITALPDRPEFSLAQGCHHRLHLSNKACN
jgi:hypothetical protein